MIIRKSQPAPRMALNSRVITLKSSTTGIRGDELCYKTVEHASRSFGIGEYLRVVFSLLFGILPGATTMVIPSVVHATTISRAPSSPNSYENPMSSSSSLLSITPEDVKAEQRQSADAARLLLEDFYGKKSPRLPASVKNQMDMQDTRLASCQEASEAGTWEQCFFYGTDNVGTNSGAYFGSLPRSPPSESNGKMKIPTW